MIETAADEANSLTAAFCDPQSYAALKEHGDLGLENPAGMLYRYADTERRVIDFVEPFMATEAGLQNLAAYNASNSVEIYRNFLDWLFESFDQNESAFRESILAKVCWKEGMKVLVVGCGLGEDLPLLSNRIGAQGELHAQDLSKAMVLNASRQNSQGNTRFTISDGNALPYRSRYFDVVYHFGGINLFGDMRKSISELERVCKIGGRVLFGDEGVAPHLRGSQYADVAINNIRLWAKEAPMSFLPYNAADIELTYLLGNCFYLIGFTPGDGFPRMNIDVKHAGWRGGSARTRYFGQLEGVTESTKQKIVTEAKARGVSVHELLEEFINKGLTQR